MEWCWMPAFAYRRRSLFPEVVVIAGAALVYARPLTRKYFGANARRSIVHGVALLFSAGSISPRTTRASSLKAVDAAP